MLLTSRVVLVTGGARGIGAAICRVLAREGAAVAVNYSASREAALALVEELAVADLHAAVFQADVRDIAATIAMIDAIVEKFGRLDGLINNAIAGRQHGSFDEANWPDYANMLDFNCKAVVNTVKAARPHMARQGGGRIVNIVTELWNSAPGDWSAYLAGKGAMVGLSRSLAQELGSENITVNMVAPGWMVTETVDRSSDASKSYASTVPLRRHGDAEEIGKACAFFLSDLASFVSGAYLPVTGGHVTQAGV